MRLEIPAPKLAEASFRDMVPTPENYHVSFKKKNVKQLRHFRMRDVIATSHVYNVSV
jgi:hypothetical protein